MADIPLIISLDDHVIEPPHLWQRWLPSGLRERGPRVVRDGSSIDWIQGVQVFRKGGDGPETDWWVYDDVAWSHQMLNACAGYDESEWWMGPIAFDQMRAGCYEPSARLADMDLNHVEASLCFPTFPRFCGQLFAERSDKELALVCVRAFAPPICVESSIGAFAAAVPRMCPVVGSVFHVIAGVDTSPVKIGARAAVREARASAPVRVPASVAASGVRYE